MRLILVLSLVGLQLLTTSATIADDSRATLGDYNADLSPPDLTAFTLLGVTGRDISRPGSASELAINFLNAGAQGKTISPSVGVEWTPMRTFAPKSISAYKNGWWYRQAQLSFATNRDSLGTSMALGWRWVPIDRTDAITGDDILDREVTAAIRAYDVLLQEARNIHDFHNNRLNPLAEQLGRTDEDITSIQLALTTALSLGGSARDDSKAGLYQRVVDSLKVRQITENYFDEDQTDTIKTVCTEYALIFGNRPDEVTREVNNAVKLAKERFKRRSWNATVLNLAGGWVWRSSDDTWKGLTYDYFRGYAGLALRLPKVGQLILQASYDMYPDSDTLMEKASSYGGRFLAGGSDLRATGEISWAKTVGRGDLPDQETWRIMVGVETRLREALWLEVGFGNVGPAGDIEDGDIVTMANLKYTLNPSSKIRLPNSN